MNLEPSNLLSVRGLRIAFRVEGRDVPVVEGVDLDVAAQETVALVGESGCGKTVSALALGDLVPAPGRRTGGTIRLDGVDLDVLGPRERRALRGRGVAYVFQDPGSALNPVLTIGRQMAECLRPVRGDKGMSGHGGPLPRRAETEVARLLGLVGLAEPERRLRQYPHELSGGMQQRVVLAMALACRPRLLVADEPTTALDATTQVQILDLLRRLQEQERMAVLLITHNFGVVAALARRAYVMYAGRVVEAGPVARLLARPAHPYTRGLIEAVPRLTGARTRLTGIPGAAPEPAARPAGCAFHPRCRWAQAACREREPALERTGEEHEVRCHFWKLIA